MSSDENLRDLQRQIARISGSIGKLAGDKPTMLFKDFAEPYCAAKMLKPNIRKATKVSFENQVTKHLVPAFGHLPLDKITNAEWIDWFTKPRSITRFFNARKTLLELLMAAKRAEHIDKVPELDDPDLPRDTGRALEEQEIIRILWRARRPFRAIFYTFWKMGCRPREILQWEWSMVQWNGALAKISIPARISKTGRTRTIPLNPKVSAMLARRKFRTVSQFVFPSRDSLERPQMSYQAGWKTACTRSRVRNAVVYDFRRTYITRRAAEGKPMLFVAKYLDTSLKQIEGVYAKTDWDTMEDIAR